MNVIPFPEPVSRGELYLRHGAGTVEKIKIIAYLPGARALVADSAGDVFWLTGRAILRLCHEAPPGWDELEPTPA